jgi:hypothetical protein
MARPETSDLRIVKSPVLKKLAAYWMFKRKDGEPPERHHIDPVEIPSLLPHIWMLEREEVSARYRVRLAGESVNALFGGRLKGRYFDELFAPEHVDLALDNLVKVFRMPAICYQWGPLHRRGMTVVIGEKIAFPLRAESGREIALGGIVYRLAEPEEGDNALLEPPNITLLAITP